MSDQQVLKKGIDCIGLCVVYYCHDGKGNLLFTKRSQAARDEQGTWDVGGGAVELFDTIDETIRKEIKEEFMTDVISYEFLNYRDVHRQLANGQKTHWLALDFIVEIDPSQAQIGEPHKFDEMRWVTLDNLPQPLHSQLMISIEQNKPKLLSILKR